MDIQEEYEKRRHSNYLEERDRLINAEWRQAAQQDKYVLTLSAGVFSVSIAFIDKIAKHPIDTYLLITAWWIFVATILLTLVSFVTSQSAARRQRDILEEGYKTRTEDQPRRNCSSDATKVLNFLSFGTFILGLIFLTIFITINFS